MIKAVLIDDEANNNMILANMLREFCPDVVVTGVAETVAKGEALIRKFKPDLVFLDIEMPYGNGFDLLDRLRPINFEVVFVTAFNEYAIRAFRYSALDYLLKPVEFEKLQEAVAKAERNLQLKNFGQRLDLYMHTLEKINPSLQKIALPAKKGVVLVPLSDIIRCEANRGYTLFIIKNMEKIISSKNIKEYEELLPANLFLRIHHSHLVNYLFIRGYHYGRGGKVEMEDGALVEVSPRQKNKLLERIGLKY
jgi:two-component system LytT family response regulator